MTTAHHHGDDIETTSRAVCYESKFETFKYLGNYEQLNDRHDDPHMCFLSTFIQLRALSWGLGGETGDL